MQIRNQVIQLLLGNGIAHRRHHVAATHNRLLHKTVVGHQAAGQILLLVQAFHAGAFEWLGTIGAMTYRALDLKHTPTLRLLGIQSQLGVGLQGRVFFASGKNRQQNQAKRNGRYLPQMSIMFCSAAF